MKAQRMLSTALAVGCLFIHTIASAGTLSKTEQALEDQLSCKQNPSPALAINAMLKNGYLRDEDLGSDGVPVFVANKEMNIFGAKVLYVAGWEADENGNAKKPFFRGVGTAPPTFIAVTLSKNINKLDYKSHEVRSNKGETIGSHSYVDESSLNDFEEPKEKVSTITCYSGSEDNSNSSNDVQDTEVLKKCVSLLEIGIYNTMLEESCGFSGEVSQHLIKTYTEGGCRTIVPQSTVDRLSSQSFERQAKEIKNSSKYRFCLSSKKEHSRLRKVLANQNQSN